MLGYRGRSDRREFIAGTALLVVGTAAFSMAVKPLIPWMFAVLERPVALGLALLLGLVTCAAVVAWFWGWTALATRRARDIGWPAWAGVLSLVALVAVGRATVGLPAPADAVASWGVIIIWFAALGLWPSGRGMLAPSATGAESVPG